MHRSEAFESVEAHVQWPASLSVIEQALVAGITTIGVTSEQASDTISLSGAELCLKNTITDSTSLLFSGGKLAAEV